MSAAAVIVEAPRSHDERQSVIGCVWGAHRRLVEVLGDEAPSYEQCEHEWTTRLAKKAPAPAALPAWLYQELFFALRQPGDRPEITRQLSMFEAAR